MDKLAKRILKETVQPTMEKMLDGVGLSPQELMAVGQQVDIAKDLIECDLLLVELACKKKMMEDEGPWDESQGDMDNPKRRPGVPRSGGSM